MFFLTIYCCKMHYIMTIKEEKLVRNYIAGLVREAVFKNAPDPEEKDMEFDDVPEPEERKNDSWKEMDRESEFPEGHYDEPDVKTNKNDEFGSPAGLDELRKLCEGYARAAISKVLSEGKKGSSKKKKSKEKTSSRDKTVVAKLNSDGVNAASYYYKLYGVENGTDAEKASARSKGYKKAKGKKNDSGVPYKFSSKERNRLNSLLTDIS